MQKLWDVTVWVNHVAWKGRLLENVSTIFTHTLNTQADYTFFLPFMFPFIRPHALLMHRSFSFSSLWKHLCSIGFRNPAIEENLCLLVKSARFPLLFLLLKKMADYLSFKEINVGRDVCQSVEKSM